MNNKIFKIFKNIKKVKNKIYYNNFFYKKNFST